MAHAKGGVVGEKFGKFASNIDLKEVKTHSHIFKMLTALSTY